MYQWGIHSLREAINAWHDLTDLAIASRTLKLFYKTITLISIISILICSILILRTISSAHIVQQPINISLDGSVPSTLETTVSVPVEISIAQSAPSSSGYIAGNVAVGNKTNPRPPLRPIITTTIVRGASTTVETVTPEGGKTTAVTVITVPPAPSTVTSTKRV